MSNLTPNSDLNDNPNPYAQGSVPVDLTATSDYLGGAAFPYYANPPTVPQVNPRARGSADASQSLSDAMASGQDALYADILARSQPTQSPNPTESDDQRDSGFGPSGIGQS